MQDNFDLGLNHTYIYRHAVGLLILRSWWDVGGVQEGGGEGKFVPIGGICSLCEGSGETAPVRGGVHGNCQIIPFLKFL